IGPQTKYAPSSIVSVGAYTACVRQWCCMVPDLEAIVYPYASFTTDLEHVMYQYRQLRVSILLLLVYRTWVVVVGHMVRVT
ncbi:11367_t:CDS:1, partial [Cetraspora pellucida]